MEEAKQILNSYLEYPEMDNIELMKKAIKTVLSELEKKDKVINEMAKEITEFTGNCPYDKYDWQDIDCEKVCEDNMKQCWVEYFTNKVEREGKQYD